MIDAKRLLEQFLGSAGGGMPGQNRDGHRGGQSSGGGLLGSVQDLARNNPMLSGGAAGGLAALLLGSKKGRKLAGSALKWGGIAAIGGLAYKAYRDYQAGQVAQNAPQHPAPQQPASYQTAPYQGAGYQAPTHLGQGVPVLPPPADSPFALENAPQGADVFALELVAAMINAAKADGHIDAQERARIEGRLAEGGLEPEERAFLSRELAAPLDIERVVRAAKTREEAVELYAASFIAITPDHPAERAYLDMLAARLGLEPALARTVEQTVASAQA